MSLLRRFVVSSWNTATSTMASRFPLHPSAPSAWSNSPQNIVARTFASKKHKRLLQFSKGFRGRAKNCYSIAVRRVEKSWQYAYRDRRRKRREYKKVWIQRISAGVRQYAFRYSEFMHLLNLRGDDSKTSSKNSNIQLNRKILADLAANEPFAFKAIVDVVQESTGVKKEHAKYSHQDGWEFDDDQDEEEDYYYEPDTMAWIPKKKKKQK
ncbi:protein L20 [Seminavis robusta]|uniref:Protein L20 n=1 Tax=Seminavis robusta TaxID=568900 RepID=A0A9N8E6X3_9STRA|nr:protein L20 [Seminavis robusta]|eukprot:Sro560_g166720.1 protein L20 (210) ;mRNA; r:58142-58866